MSIVTEIQSLAPDAIVTLYELDLTALGETIHYFHNGTNELETDVIWQGNTYTAFPIEMEGFEVSKKGEIPRPLMRVSNILNVIGILMSGYGDLLGAKVTRRRTFKKFLDAPNFVGGVNPDADPTVAFGDDVYYIERKIIETAQFVELELGSPWDVHGVLLPRRQIAQNVCPWVYKGVECGYVGGDIADIFDNLVGSAAWNIGPQLDQCSKSIIGCKIRFGDSASLPYGGFPGAGKTI
jgi:lambda family phage minor tail protein L